jgi:hypothetical protein
MRKIISEKISMNSADYIGSFSSSRLKRLMNKTYILLTVIIMLLLILFSACGESLYSTPQITKSSLAQLYFPVQKEFAEATADGLLNGNLVFINGYLLVEVYESKVQAREIIIWPYGYSVSTDGNRIQVLDEKGQPRFRVGDNVQIGGGEVPSDFAEEKIGKPLPVGIKGPFWLASGTTMVPYMPIRMSNSQPLSSFNSNITGQLVLENNLLRLKILHGKNYLAFWPYGYSLRLEGQKYRVYDEQGQPTVWAGANNYYDGDIIDLNGRELSAEDAASSIGLPSLPNFWNGPYWLVYSVTK